MTVHRTKFDLIVQGLAGSEGPVFDASGEQFFMVAPEVEVDGKAAGQVLSVNIFARKATVILSPSFDGCGGIPAGCQMDKYGDLWIADMRLGLLHVNTKTGDCKQICTTDVDGNDMQGCNDCVFDSFGNLWITAPAGSIAPAPYTRSMQEPFGSLYCYTSDGIMKRIDSGYRFPNGIAVQYDKKGQKPQNLIVAETPAKTLWSIPFVAEKNGVVDVSRKKIFGRCPGDHDGGPDGMDFDYEGNLLVANWGSGYIDVFGDSGDEPISRIELPFKKVSNLHFRPRDNAVFVTEHDTHGLWQFTWVNSGARHYCEMA